MDNRPHDGLIRLLAPQLDTLNRRQAFVVSALGLTSPIIARLNFDQAAHEIVLHLCKTISPDISKLDAVLDEAKRQLTRPSVDAEKVFV